MKIKLPLSSSSKIYAKSRARCVTFVDSFISENFIAIFKFHISVLVLVMIIILFLAVYQGMVLYSKNVKYWVSCNQECILSNFHAGMSSCLPVSCWVSCKGLLDSLKLPCTHEEALTTMALAYQLQTVFSCSRSPGSSM